MSGGLFDRAQEMADALPERLSVEDLRARKEEIEAVSGDAKHVTTTALARAQMGTIISNGIFAVAVAMFSESKPGTVIEKNTVKAAIDKLQDLVFTGWVPHKGSLIEKTFSEEDARLMPSVRRLMSMLMEVRRSRFFKLETPAENKLVISAADLRGLAEVAGVEVDLPPGSKGHGDRGDVIGRIG
jgi:hypothetical protein